MPVPKLIPRRSEGKELAGGPVEPGQGMLTDAPGALGVTGEILPAVNKQPAAEGPPPAARALMVPSPAGVKWLPTCQDGGNYQPKWWGKNEHEQQC